MELASFYFDIRKDTLYCDSMESLERQAARTVLDQLFSTLATWLSPIIPFTTEEAWLTRFPGEEEYGSIHLRQFCDIPSNWRDDDLAAKWELIRKLRRVVTGALEIERAEKRIGSSLSAEAIIYTSNSFKGALSDINLADLCITSSTRFGEGEAPSEAFTVSDIPDVKVMIVLASGEKCARCWKVLPEVGAHEIHKDLCNRCADVIGDTPVFA